DAIRSAVHRDGNGVAESDRDERNGRTDDRQDQRIFGSRSTRIVAQHVDESLHVTIPSLKAPALLPESGLTLASRRPEKRKNTPRHAALEPSQLDRGRRPPHTTC